MQDGGSAPQLPALVPRLGADTRDSQAHPPQERCEPKLRELAGRDVWQDQLGFSAGYGTSGMIHSADGITKTCKAQRHLTPRWAITVEPHIKRWMSGHIHNPQGPSVCDPL